MASIVGTRIVGHIDTPAGRVAFAGTVSDVYPTGGRMIVTVACDDGNQRSARPENVHPEELPTPNVESVLGGKTHLGNRGSLPVPFPLCTSASRNTGTRYRNTTGPVTCRECAGILARRAARLATA